MKPKTAIMGVHSGHFELTGFLRFFFQGLGMQVLFSLVKFGFDKSTSDLNGIFVMKC